MNAETNHHPSNCHIFRAFTVTYFVGNSLYNFPIPISLKYNFDIQTFFLIYLNIMWVLLMFYFIKLNTFTILCWNYIGFIHTGTHRYHGVTLTRKNRFLFQNSKFFIPRATPGTLVNTLNSRNRKLGGIVPVVRMGGGGGSQWGIRRGQPKWVNSIIP